jgi:hypothetical protein
MDIKCKNCGSYINIREVVSRCTECGKELFNSNKENMKSVFKDGDTVFHYQHGEGVFKQCENTLEYTVLFLKGISSEPALVGTGIYDLLSFTPYRFEGFTQERPFEPIVGNYYWFWTPAMLVNQAIGYGKFVGMKNGRYQFGNNEVEYCSENNPLECQ